MKNKSSKKYVSVAELGKMLGISRIAVFKRIQKGQIPAEKIGHSYAISMDDVKEIIQGKDLTSLSEEKKIIIQKAVEKTVKEYGKALRLLGKE